MSVAAIVVTHNRRELLRRCVEGILAQTRRPSRVLVVDNASTDGTEQLAAELPVDYVRLERNAGGAGGFAEGISITRESGVEWLWLFDDDCRPRPDALERLLAAAPAADLATAALCPKVLLADGAIDRNQRGHFHHRLRPLPESIYAADGYPELGYLSFAGSLLRAAATRAIALPRADFFVWGDDVEYSLRLRGVGALRLVSEAVVDHDRVTFAHETRRSRVVNALLPVKLHPTPIERFWQNLYGLRNYIWIKREYERQSALSAAGTTLQFMAKHLLCDDRPLTRMRWIVRFARDGRAGRFDNSWGVAA